MQDLIKELVEHDVAVILNAATEGLFDKTLNGKQDMLQVIQAQTTELRNKLLFTLEQQKEDIPVVNWPENK